MREVISVQVGTYANYVGAHFWNFQDELAGLDRSSPEGLHADDIDSDVLFNVGETRHGLPTYTPRLLVFDVKGQLGSVRAVGSLYEEAPVADLSTVATWAGPKKVYRSEAVQKSKFRQCLEEEAEEDPGHATGPTPDQKGSQTETATKGSTSPETAALALEEEVRYWTDYLKAHLHPSSVTDIVPDWVEREEGGSMRSFGEGKCLLGGEEAAEERREGLRVAVEACDHLQGFQCSVDESGGFSALGTDLLREMSDEYARVPRLVLGLRPPLPQLLPPRPGYRPQMLLTDVVSFTSLSGLADLYVPLGRASSDGALFPHLRFNPASAFHTTALTAAATDTLTMPYRLRPAAAMDARGGAQGAVDMSSLVRLLARTPATSVAAAAMAMPAANLGGRLSSGLTSLTEGVEVRYPLGQGPLAEAFVLRGGRHKGSRSSAPVSEAYDALQGDILSQRCGLCVRHLALSQQPLPIPLPFPQSIFSIPANGSGSVSEGRDVHNSSFGPDVESVPVLTRLAIGPQLLPLLREKISILKDQGLRRGAPGSTLLATWGIPREDSEEMVEQLETFVRGHGGGGDEDVE